MANKVISDFVATSSPADNDLMLIERNSDGAYRKVTVSNFRSALDELGELSDVNISSPSNNQVLSYDSGSSTWVNISENDSVLSVNGKTGTVVLNTGDISEGSNLYYTDARVSANSDVVTNTAKNSYPSADSTKVGYISVSQAVNLDTMESDITTNNAKVSNATHTGDVTGSTVLTLADSGVTAGSYTNADITVDSKGRVTSASNGSGGSGGASTLTFTRNYSGNLSTGRLIPIIIPDEADDLEIKEVRLSLESLPTGADVLVDVRKNGTASTDSVFTSDVAQKVGTGETATNGLFMTACDEIGSRVGTAGTTLDSDRDGVSSDDVLWVYVTQVGSTLSGSDLVVTITVA